MLVLNPCTLAAREKFLSVLRYQCIVFSSFNIPTYIENEVIKKT